MAGLHELEIGLGLEYEATVTVFENKSNNPPPPTKRKGSVYKRPLFVPATQTQPKPVSLPKPPQSR